MENQNQPSENEKAAFAGNDGQQPKKDNLVKSSIPQNTAPFEHIPAELKALNQWLVWKREERTKKGGGIEAAKVPKQTNGYNASTDKPQTWTSFQKAVEAYQAGNFDGIGFVLKNTPFVGIDLDKVDGWEERAAEIIQLMSSYTEVSPSGNGYRIFVKGSKPGKRERAAGKFPLEMYDTSSTRFLTVTGNHVPGTPLTIEERNTQVGELFEAEFTKDEPEAPAAAPSAYKLPDDMTDEQVWQDMFSSEAGGKIRALYDGDLSAHHGDQSAADLALCCYLAWFTKKDPARIDRMFRQSKLWRPKWDEYRGDLKYGQMTLQKAMKTTVLPEEELAAAKEAVAAALQQAAAGDMKAPFQPETIGALALLQEKDPAEYAQIKIDLKQQKLSIRDIEKAIRKARSQLRLVQTNEPEAQPQGEDQLKRDWIIDENGHLYRRKFTESGWQNVRVTRTAPTIQKVLIAEQSSYEYWEIGFKTVRGRSVTVQVARDSISTKRGIITELSKYGFDIGEDNARDVSKYLRDYAAAYAEQTEEQRFVEFFGWTEDYKSFVIGNEVIGSPEVIFKAPGAGEQQLADGFKERGTFEGWKQITQLVREKPWVMFKIYQAFLPPLLPILRVNGHSLANWGESSEGKTLTDQVAASVWGNPDYKGEDPSVIMQGKGMTNDRLEKGLSLSRHLPYFLQDAHEARADIAAALHNVEMGQTSPKGDISNGSRKVKPIKTVWFITSETSITGLKPQGGIAARLIEKNGSPLEGKNPLLAYQIERTILEHYGQAGRRFIEYLMANRGKWDDWRAAFQDMQEQAIQQTADLDSKVSRTNKYYIAVMMAGKLADEALGLGLGEEQVERDIGLCLAEARETMDTRPYHEKALDVLRDWVQANRRDFYVTGGDSNQGYERNIPGVWNERQRFVAMLPTRVEDVLEQHGFELNRCKKEWRDKGYLNLDKNGNPLKNTKFPPTKTSPRMYQFTFEALHFDEAAEE